MTAVMIDRPTTSAVKVKRRIRVQSPIIRHPEKPTEPPAPQRTAVTLRGVWLRIVDRFARLHPFFQYAVFFGTALAGSLALWSVMESAAAWVLLFPLLLLGFPNLALWSYSILAVAMWASATLVWFAKLDRWFRI